MDKKTVGLIGLCMLVVLTFSGCASLGPSGEEEFHSVIRLIGEGDAGALKSSSRLPFLLDGEILLGETEVNLLWDGLAAAGFAFHNPEIEEVFPAAPEHYTLFGDTMDVKVFFEKYLDKKDTIVRFHSEEGRFVLLLSSRKTGSRIGALGGGY